MKPINQFDYVFRVNRREYFKDTTIGEMILPQNGEKFGWTLEDEVRGFGIKVPKHTAIPETGINHAYNLDLRESPKYGLVPVIYSYTEGEEYILEGPDGVIFKYILIHGGNDDEDTDGCILVAKNRPSLTTIQEALHKTLVKLIQQYKKSGVSLGISIVNMPQENTKFV